MYLRIQTNRAKLKEVLVLFAQNAIESERLIAPRPLPKSHFKFYIGFAHVIDDSKNMALLTKIKNHKQIEKSTFEEEVEAIEYYWEASDKSV